MTLLGIGSGLLLFHITIADLNCVFAAMQKTANSITTLNRGYDPISFIVKIVLFLRDWIFMGLVVCGAIVISNKISKCSYLWIGNIVLITLMLAYAYYQKMPKVTSAMLMSSIWIGLLYEKYQDQSINLKDWLNFDAILNVFLVFAPLILSIGTNVYLGGKMRYFMLPWVLLLYRLNWQENKSNSVCALNVFMALGMLFGLWNVPQTINTQKTLVADGPLAGMHLTLKQVEHFALCDSIMSCYGFDSTSVVFTTQLGSMTNCYLDAKTYHNYFQPMDFLANPKFDNRIPNFLFLCQYDEDVAGEQIRKMGWGWPDDYDVYEVGTPETKIVGYPTERKLYCRKNNK